MAHNPVSQHSSGIVCFMAVANVTSHSALPSCFYKWQQPQLRTNCLQKSPTAGKLVCRGGIDNLEQVTTLHHFGFVWMEAVAAGNSDCPNFDFYQTEEMWNKQYCTPGKDKGVQRSPTYSPTLLPPPVTLVYAQKGSIWGDESIRGNCLRHQDVLSESWVWVTMGFFAAILYGVGSIYNNGYSAIFLLALLPHSFLADTSTSGALG